MYFLFLLVDFGSALTWHAVHLRHEFSAEIYDAEAQSVFLTRDQRADVISSDEEVVPALPRARPDVMPAEDGSDVSVSGECGAHVMETESLASAAEVYKSLCQTSMVQSHRLTWWPRWISIRLLWSNCRCFETYIGRSLVFV